MASREKYCPMCQRTLPVSSFYRDRSRRDGFAGVCKTCHGIIRKRYDSSAKGREMKRAWRQTPKGRAEMARHNKSEKTKIAKHRWWKKHGIAVMRRYNQTPKSRDRILRYQRSEKGQSTFSRLSAIRRASSKIETSLTTEQWRDILKQYEHRCAYCRRSHTKLEKDHVIPVTKGGMHTASNVVPACRSCNARKNSRLDFSV